MAAPPTGGRILRAGRPTVRQGLSPSRRLDSEVIDLSADADHTAAAAPAPVASTPANDLRGTKLEDFAIGDRLGQTRDGGEGFQGCNSRVFRVTLRRNHPAPTGPAGNNKRMTSGVHHRPPRASSSLPPGASDRGAGNSNPGGMSSPGTSRGGRMAGDLLVVGEQLVRGTFGACFRGDYGCVVEREGGKRRDACRTGGKGDGGTETEWALKMALTLRGQDPAQAKREMETEIAVLVGGRIPPHPNIMRGVHSFQDEIGRDLQPRLWAGLGPDVGETLSPRTSFVLMPLFTAGSLQALLNKRRLRCKGPPFLRLLEAMRFLEQMLSAVSHLLAHGVAHNDIKPDNWLLRADQRTLVLTDFGACIDSSAPPKAGSPCLSRPSAVARPASDARAKTAAAAKGGSKAASLPYPSSMCGPTAAVPHTASVTAASSINRSTAVVPSAISPSAAWSPYRSAGAKNPAAPAPTAAATAAQVTSGTRREQPTGVGGLLPLSARSRRAGGAFSELFAARSPAPASAFDAAMGQATARFATSVAEATARRKRPRVDDGPPPATEVSSGFGADESEDRGRKRPRGCDGQGGGDGGQAYRGPAVSKEEPKACSLPANSEKLVFPFSSYCATGTPGFLAPEVARAWRKKEVLDFRRSDVFSVGVCMYRMLRPDSGDIDNVTGLEGKGPLEPIKGRFGQEAWPLPLFPENKGGCPYEVSQLCRGLLQADPAQRQDASEGLSLASWFVSRLEDAEKAGVKGVPAPSRSGVGSRSEGSTAAGCGTVDGKSGAAGNSGGSSVAGVHESRASLSDTKRDGLVVASVDRQREASRAGLDTTSPHRHHTSETGGLAAAPTNGHFLPWCESRVAVPAKNPHTTPAGAMPSPGPRSNPMLPLGDVRDRGAQEGGKTAHAASGGAAAGRGSVSEEERRLGEPDELVRSDRISHMRDFFASAAPENLFEALDSKAWDVAAACADFDDNASGQGRGEKRKSGEDASSTPASRVTLFFEGVAEELKGRRRELLSPPRHRQPFARGSLQIPPASFGP